MTRDSTLGFYKRNDRDTLKMCETERLLLVSSYFDNSPPTALRDIRYVRLTFNYNRCTLTSTNTESGQTTVDITTFHLVKKSDKNSAARCTNRVA